ncbi:MAG: ATP-binding cassette domain-containing protein [Endomicrobium sp.]|jgi:iron complex transport system ATP-binding protein|nr:ATP-binding cassette domain-containing protein [Endomicrobium sp.]
MNDFFVEMKNISVVRSGREILSSINLAVKIGENVAVIGPNGSGKSTFIKLIVRSIYPSYTESGIFKLFGHKSWNVSDLRSMLGIVTSGLQYSFHSRITGIEAVLSGFFSSIGIGKNHNVTKSMVEKAEKAMNLLEVLPLKDEKLENMSSGEARRFLIARAVVNQPKVLILDEPSNSLDIASSLNLHKIMRKIVASGTNIILVTHLVSDIIPEMDRFILFKNGRIFADGERKNIFTGKVLSSLFGVNVELSENKGFCTITAV